MQIPPRAPGTPQSSKFPVSSCGREGTDSARVRLCFTAATLLCARMGGSPSREKRESALAPPRELREFTAVPVDRVPRSDFPTPMSKTRQENEDGGSAHHQRLSLTSLASQCNSEVVSVCCDGLRVSLRPAIPHFHLD